jgi:hypothetical protein
MIVQQYGCYFDKQNSAMLLFLEIIFNFHVEWGEMEQWLSLLVQ